jgi:hypothetical protein
MIYPTSLTSPDLLIRRPDDDRRTGSQNEGWDYSLFRVTEAAEAAPSNANVDVAELFHHTAAAAAEAAASPLDDFLSGKHHHNYPFGFTISIPSRNEHEHKLSLPAATPSATDEKSEEWFCEESASLVSELTQMTYRAELMKQVSTNSEMVLIMCMCFDQPLTSCFHI